MAATSKSQQNGVIRIGRKGIVKFAFGEDGPAFEVDVVTTYWTWSELDDQFRVQEGPDVRPEDVGTISDADLPHYRASMLEFVKQVAGPDYADEKLVAEDKATITHAEAFDFIARLREQYHDLQAFFLPKSREERASPASSGVEHRFSVEES